MDSYWLWATTGQCRASHKVSFSIRIYSSGYWSIGPFIMYACVCACVCCLRHIMCSDFACFPLLAFGFFFTAAILLWRPLLPSTLLLLLLLSMLFNMINIPFAQQNQWAFLFTSKLFSDAYFLNRNGYIFFYCCHLFKSK